jgi:hypothetical protein
MSDLRWSIKLRHKVSVSSPSIDHPSSVLIVGMTTLIIMAGLAMLATKINVNVKENERHVIRSLLESTTILARPIKVKT